MSIFDRIREYFEGGRSGLRNKRDGLAWIRFDKEGDGREVLNGHVVKTLLADAHGFWRVEPEQSFVATAHVVDFFGHLVLPGEVAPICGIADHCLVPIPSAGLTKEEVEALYESSPAKGEVDLRV